MSEKLTVKKIDFPAGRPVFEVSAIMDDPALKLQVNDIDNVNWPDSYPAKPKVSFRIAHNGREIFLKFNVEEEYTMALVDQDQGRTWTDSCVEFFIAFDDTGYYNFEFTCIGRCLSHFNVPGKKSESAPPELMSYIKRLSSLGMETFPERKGDNKWSLTVVIPVESFFKHRLVSFNRLGATANFYKCGDDLTVPHFLSWNPIDWPKPNFHLPKFFGKVKFR